MKLSLREFDDFPARVRLEAGPETFEPFTEEVKRVAHVTVSLAIQKAEDEYYVQGDLDAELVMECVRCLREFTTRVEGSTDFIVNADGHGPTGERNETDDEDYIPYTGADQIVDISDQVRQALVLAVEMKPLCEENCRGLCAHCGRNLNEGPCNCKDDDYDPRWEGLRGLSEQ